MIRDSFVDTTFLIHTSRVNKCRQMCEKLLILELRKCGKIFEIRDLTNWNIIVFSFLTFYFSPLSKKRVSFRDVHLFLG